MSEDHYLQMVPVIFLKEETRLEDDYESLLSTIIEYFGKKDPDYFSGIYASCIAYLMKEFDDRSVAIMLMDISKRVDSCRAELKKLKAGNNAARMTGLN